VGINKVITIDAELGGIIDTISTEFPPRMDALAATAKIIYVLDFLGKKIYEVSLESKKITHTIIPEFPEDAIGGISYGGKRGTLFISSFDLNDINNASKYKVYEINAKTGKVINSIAVPIAPFGVAYSEASKALIVSTGDFMQKSSYVINPDNGNILGSFSGAYSALASDEGN
jgi:DNA-binding beta-propeller fold protein YncE